MMQRFIFALTFLLTLAAPLQAQGDEIFIFQRTSEAARDGRIAMFDVCAEQTGIAYRESYVPPAQYEIQLPTVLSSDSLPDVYSLWPGGRARFQAERGRIEPMTDVYESDIAPLIYEGVNQGVTEPDGEVYVMAYNVLPNVIFYNTKKFEAYGLTPPETWDEFLSILETLKENGETPITLGSQLGWEPLFWFDYLILRTAGPEFREGLMSGTESYTDPRVVEAMELWRELLEAGYFNENITSLGWEDMVSAMATESAAMMLMGPWAIRTLQGAGLTPNEDFDFFPFPVIDPDVPMTTEGALEGWALSGGGANTEDAKRFIACFASVEAQEAYASIAQQPVTNPDVPISVFDEDLQPMMERLKELNTFSFHQNLELATIPPVTEIAKREFPRFLTFPDQYMTVLEQLERRAKSEFGE